MFTLLSPCQVLQALRVLFRVQLEYALGSRQLKQLQQTLGGPLLQIVEGILFSYANTVGDAYQKVRRQGRFGRSRRRDRISDWKDKCCLQIS
jgi:hypothetical protein